MMNIAGTVIFNLTKKVSGVMFSTIRKLFKPPKLKSHTEIYGMIETLMTEHNIDRSKWTNREVVDFVFACRRKLKQEYEERIAHMWLEEAQRRDDE